MTIRRFVGALSAILIGLLVTAPSSQDARAAGSATIRLGSSASQTDAPIFIAMDKGFFRDQGIEIELVRFPSSANMIAPLGTGQLDVGGGNVSPALYNAIGRGIDVKIVANKGSQPPGYGYTAILVRKDLVTSGKVKSIRDFKGLKVAGPMPDSNLLEYALEMGGLTLKDVSEVILGFPEHIAAFENGSIDASVTVEPFVTRAIESGSAVRLLTGDQIEPNMTTSSILYGGPFMKNKPDLARKFMLAYIQGVRYYNDALKGGHLAGPTSNEVIATLTKYTAIKDPAVYRAITPNGVDPDGRLNATSMRRDVAFYKSVGLVTGDVTFEQAIDTSYAESAVKILGRYKAAK
jgi:NitT/TauT family transport system substrate-binding protein